MASSEEELTSLLIEVGKKLEMPPTSVKELLALLDRVEVYLSRVEQSPSKEIQSALSPTKKALVSDGFLRHANIDVKVAVASCVSEITRITAPEVPYEDDQMKEAFQLIVSTFERLPDKSSRSYAKRISILETVAKVRSCVVMLDLECDELILVMIRHFVKAIRDYHPENVFTSMESIMMRVIEESEEISSDLLFCILESVKKDNEEVTPVARKMMEKVIQTCADKLVPYIKTAVRTKELLLADYDEVVNYLCLETSAETIGQSEHSDAFVEKVLADASKPLEPSSDAFEVAVELPVFAVSAVEVLPADGFSDVATSNGIADAEVDTISVSSTMQDSKSSNPDKVPDTVTAGPSAAVCNPDAAEVETDTKTSETINPLTLDDNLDAEKVVEESKTEPKAEKIMKKRGRKPKAKKKTPKSKLAGKFSAVKQAEELAEPHKSSNEPNCPSQGQEPSNEAAEHSSAKLLETDDVSSKGISGEAGQSDKKLDECSKSKTVISSLENHTSVDMKKTISTVSDLEERTTIPKVDASEVKATASKADVPMGKTDAPDDENLKEDTIILTSDAVPEGEVPLVDEPLEEVESSVGKSHEQLGVVSKDPHDMEDDPSETKNEIKRRGGKATLRKHTAQAAQTNNKDATTSQKLTLKSTIEEGDLKETPKTSTKRKHIEENKDESKDYGEELVGSKVKVWWPADKRYYKGVIGSFDSAKKKHKVLYADGEVENLVLNKQRWEVINPDEDSDTESNEGTPDAASGKRHKGKEVNEGTSRKRLGRRPSSKSESASNKPGGKRNDLVNSDIKARGDSKEEDKSEVESVKKLGRARTDVSKSAGKQRAVVSKSSGKSRADESKRIGKSTTEEALSSGKSRAGIKDKSDSKAASKAEVETSNIKQKGPKEKGTKSDEETRLMKSPGKSNTRELNKSESGSATKVGNSKATSAPKSKGRSPKTSPKKVTEKAESDSKVAADEQIPSPAKEARSSKRKAPVLDKENNSGAKSEQKRKRGRK